MKAKLTRIASAAALLGATALFALGAAGCSPESKAEKTLEKYKDVFKMCKDMTEQMKASPGEHQCALVTSMAVEMGLKDSGLEEAKWRDMLSKWLDQTGYRPYFVPPEKRKPEHR